MSGQRFCPMEWVDEDLVVMCGARLRDDETVCARCDRELAEMGATDVIAEVADYLRVQTPQIDQESP